MKFKVWFGTGNMWREFATWNEAQAHMLYLLTVEKVFTAHVELI